MNQESSPRPKAEIWDWCGRSISFCRVVSSGEAAPRPRVVLIHGFGASKDHWRHNLRVIGERYDVYALDLLGFGASDKPRSRLRNEAEAPGSVRYCFDLWAAQVVAFIQEIVQKQPGAPLHLIGNSIGGLVALRSCQLLEEAHLPPAQVILIDCAQRTLDEKRVAELSPLQRWSRPLVKRLVSQRWVIQPLFRALARPSVIRQVLQQAYPSGANIDDQLVELLYRPSVEPGAAESFRGFVNLFEDHLAPQLLRTLNVPVRMLWGAQDPWESPAEAERWAEEFDCVQELIVLPALGHCPHDEAPELVNPILLEWLSPETTSEPVRSDRSVEDPGT